MAWLLLLAACGKHAPSEPPQPEDGGGRVAAPKPHEAALADCVTGCEQRDTARAVDKAIITADCRTWCDSTPLVRTSEDLNLLIGLPVQIVGVPMTEHSSVAGEMGTSLRLDDGVRVWVSREPATEAWKALGDQAWGVTGTLRREEPPVNYFVEDPSAPHEPVLPAELKAPPLPE